MSKSRANHKRILAIYPNSRGFGFAVLESRMVLVDWGTVEPKADKHRQCLSRIEGFIRQYGPDIVVAEHPQKSSHRGKRIRKMLKDIWALTLKRKCKYRGLSRTLVRKYFHSSKPITKHQIASGIAERFPELAGRLPPPRKPWMSEDSRMAIFDAVALGLCSFRGIMNSRDCKVDGGVIPYGEICCK